METHSRILSLLKEKYPDVKYYLDFANPLQLVVAAILSPQVRDTVVNALTPALFARYQSAEEYANADVDEILKYVGKVSFARKKAGQIKETCKILHEKYRGRVPETKEELLELPGVGHKTANAILCNAFGKISGIPVDTHAIRLAQRLGFTTNNNPDKIEKDLVAILPQTEWQKFPWYLKAHGQKICKAPIPICSECFLRELCPKINVAKSK